MINANVAVAKSQQFNRDCWLKSAEKELSSKILNAAETGVREYSTSFKDLIIGAENLEEAGEMLTFLCKSLAKAGYTHKITPNGTLIISW